MTVSHGEQIHHTDGTPSWPTSLSLLPTLHFHSASCLKHVLDPVRWDTHCVSCRTYICNSHISFHKSCLQLSIHAWLLFNQLSIICHYYISPKHYRSTLDPCVIWLALWFCVDMQAYNDSMCVGPHVWSMSSVRLCDMHLSHHIGRIWDRICGDHVGPLVCSTGTCIAVRYMTFRHIHIQSSGVVAFRNLHCDWVMGVNHDIDFKP